MYSYKVRASCCIQCWLWFIFPSLILSIAKDIVDFLCKGDGNLCMVVASVCKGYKCTAIYSSFQWKITPRDARVASIIEEIITTHCHLAFDPGCCNNGKPLFPSSGSFYSLFFFSAKYTTNASYLY